MPSTEFTISVNKRWPCDVMLTSCVHAINRAQVINKYTSWLSLTGSPARHLHNFEQLTCARESDSGVKTLTSHFNYVWKFDYEVVLIIWYTGINFSRGDKDFYPEGPHSWHIPKMTDVCHLEILKTLITFESLAISTQIKCHFVPQENRNKTTWK